MKFTSQGYTPSVQTLPTTFPCPSTTPAPSLVPGSREDLGIATTAQILAGGLTRNQIEALERCGALFRVHDDVYRTGATVMSTRRHLLAACLALGGVTAASDRAALWLWELADETPPIEVTTARRTRPIPMDAIVHVRSDLIPAHVSVRRGVPVTSPARTLADAGAVVEPQTLHHALDKALYLRLVTRRQLDRIVGVARGRHDAGVAALARALDRKP